MQTLPIDILELIAENLSNHDYSIFRYIIRLPWKKRHVFQSSIKMIQDHKIIRRQSCANCTHQCITEIMWIDGYKRDWIPFCPIHVNQNVLIDIDAYCIGGIDINGRPLLT